MSPADILALATRLADPEQREEAARSLARGLGVNHVLLFVEDAEVKALLPAPGFQQPLPDSSAWRDFVARSIEAPQHERLPFGESAVPTHVAGLACPDGSVVVLVGGTPKPEPLDQFRALVPLLAATFRAERSALAGEGQAAVARAAARQSEALAAALARSQAELQAAMRELRDADERKDQFLAMLAHELRNPLAPLLTSLHLIKLRHTDPATLDRAAGIANRQIHLLTRLVDDLLDVSRITRGKIELKPERLDLTVVIARAVESAQPHLQARGHQLQLSLPAGPLWMMADGIRLEQVLVNLLGNAAKYTEPGGRIWLEVERAGAEVTLAVRDTGIGMSAELIPRVFDLFMQADRSLARSRGGLGLGLTLVNNLVRMHGGSVSAHSEGEGRGSQFRLRLPLMKAEPATSHATAEPGSGEQAPPGMPSRRILVVDDNVEAAESLAEILRHWGHEIRVTYDGLAAVKEAELFKPEQVFLDIGLPGIDGYEVALRLRQQQELNGVRLIALTGYGQASDKRRAFEAGFDVHLVKPLDIVALRRTLEDEAAGPTLPARGPG